jgi:hypothetical protein
MIICAPDLTPEIAAKFGVEPCVLATFGGHVPTTPRRGVKVLADVGLLNAKRGVDVVEYIQFVRRVRPTWAIVPDAFGDFGTTLARWRSYAPLVAKYAMPVFVAQEFHKPRVLDTVMDLIRMDTVERLALPMRQHPDASCSRKPLLCAERAERALRALCGYAAHVHLLGPALRSVKMLSNASKQCERQGTVVSFDTMAYRRAPNSALKRQLGGRWMPRNSEEAATMLEAWLRQALT